MLRQAYFTLLAVMAFGASTTLAFDAEVNRTLVWDEALDGRSLADISVNQDTFLHLALERFNARNGAPVSLAKEDVAFSKLQLLRVPKAGSSEVSVIARELAGCTPQGPCCVWPGDPPGSCPSKGLSCPKVAGCTGHHMDERGRRLLENSYIFSMSNFRNVVDRMVSGFFYTPPHSPHCMRHDNVDYGECFTSMTKDAVFVNVMSKMVSGHPAYSKTYLCLDKNDEENCTEDLKSVIHGACSLNFVAMCETWKTSVLLLFETLTWLPPTPAFFPRPAPVSGGDEEDTPVQRKNTGARHEEGIKHITPELKELASRANAVDEALYEFVSAKFCDRLKEVGLLDHPLVTKELATFQTLDQRCHDSTWVSDTLNRYKPLEPPECRLYRPFVGP